MSLEYYVKRTHNAPNEFQVSKFEGGEQPENEYRVLWHFTSAVGNKCDCMAWRSKRTRPCKHIRMVEAFINAGEPIPYLFTGE